jgi:hypothetical protein
VSAGAGMSIDPVKLARAKALCIVSDRAHLADCTRICEGLGGYWLGACKLWERMPDMQYLVLCADCAARFVQRAPLVLLGRDEEGLRLGVQEACSRLSDVTCVWARLLEPKALEIVGTLVLEDSVAEGNA